MKLFFIFALCFFCCVDLNAQCCSAGNPVAGTGFESSSTKGEWQVSSAMKYSLSDQYFFHDSKIDNPYILKSSFLYQNLWTSYSISNRISLSAEAGYFYDKSQKLSFNDEPFRLGTSGIGDITVGMKFIAIKKVKPVTQLAFSAGTKIPVGAFHQSVDGITIPVSLQPSSGAFRWTATASFQRLSADQSWGFALQAMLELSSEINKDYLIYRYGPFLRMNAGLMHRVFPKINVSLFGVFDVRGKDSREFDQVVAGTGSYSVLIQPWIQYAFSPDRILFCNVESPVYRYFYGELLGNKLAAQIGFRASFKTCKKKESI
ncbi:MAG: hypothetical protein A2W93_01705 [Bacteroidetes bacterium GWF2_43_63]|nr:MAG: hypothetical protein A2W94_10370 [Bacteroidetes bacterium GWE2_42_42]OFY55782.1 MAG: hypothetical protein A2W93_01705 [Bacteroidetes bacterium GWF2_43_63]HBG71301.1 hypothetical protein [Bacteroidales bacterium]HCB60478.1 hypothetical protein [Bacteroidales bacterium]HCY22565.1 hypothetical protein [Bacteroidales bacterium]